MNPNVVILSLLPETEEIAVRELVDPKERAKLEVAHRRVALDADFDIHSQNSGSQIDSWTLDSIQHARESRTAGGHDFLIEVDGNVS
ncbi:MAG: hypothetical protein V3S41_07935 [Spirochaetia bacterium]